MPGPGPGPGSGPEPAPAPVPGPTAVSVRRERLVAIDIARTFAIFGMMAVHLNLGYLHEGGPFTPLSWAGGFAAGGFAVLAGAAISLSSRPRDSWAVAWVRAGFRGVALFALGVALDFHAAPVIVILCVYGALFVIAVPFRRLSTRALATVGLVMVFVNPVVSFLVRDWLGPATNPEGAHYAVTWPMITGPNPVRAVLQTLFLDGEYPLTTWLPLALVGWAAHRSGLLARSERRRLAALAAALVVLSFGGSWVIEALTHVRADKVDVAYESLRAASPPESELSPESLAQREQLVESIVDEGFSEHEAREAVFPNYTRADAAVFVDGGAGVPPGDDWDGLLMAGHHTGTTLEMLQILAVTASFVAGGWLLVGASQRLGTLLSWPGRISLTLYTAHLLIRNRLITWGWLRWADTRGEAFWQVMAWWAFALLAGFVWRNRRGPLEWLMYRWVRCGEWIVSRGAREVVAASPGRLADG